MGEERPTREPAMEVTSAEQVRPGTAIRVETPLAAVALFNLGGCLFALDDSCVRCGSSLAQGSMDSGQVTCPQCGWRYDIATGCVNGVPALCVDRFEVRIVGSRVLLGLEPLAHRG